MFSEPDNLSDRLPETSATAVKSPMPLIWQLTMRFRCPVTSKHRLVVPEPGVPWNNSRLAKMQLLADKFTIGASAAAVDKFEILDLCPRNDPSLTPIKWTASLFHVKVVAW